MDNNQRNFRDAINAADATGLVAGEELITEAETRPVLLSDALHAALPPAHAAHATIDDLQNELTGASPNAQSIQRHVETLRSMPELEAIVLNWWDNPSTQRFIADLTQIGL